MCLLHAIFPRMSLRTSVCNGVFAARASAWMEIHVMTGTLTQIRRVVPYVKARLLTCYTFCVTGS